MDTFYSKNKEKPKWITVYKFYNQLINRKIILNTYAQMLKKYFVKGKNNKLNLLVLFIPEMVVKV